MNKLGTGASAAAALALACATSLSGQLSPGINADLTSIVDPSQRYAVFVPSTYTPTRRWPLALAMDPRGRALVPLERMAETAERLGWIVFSSYNTSSDSIAEPNELAVRAMIDDAQELFSIDGRRLYFAGHSGTARHSWEFADRFAQNTAGIMAFGAGLPNPAFLLTSSIAQLPAFSVFGGAGNTDYNYDEVHGLDRELDDYGVTHLFEFHPGPHAWPPADVFRSGMEWLEVRAVRNGRAQRTTEELNAIFGRRLSRAEAAERQGDIDAAFRLYESAAADFDGLLDNASAAEQVRRLRDSRAYANEVKRLRDEFADRRAFDAKVAEVVERVRRSGRPFNVNDVARDLGIETLKRRASSEDRVEANSAQRKLESLFVRASFYRPREFMGQGQFAIANAYLRLAARINPDDPFVCLQLGRTWAQMGEVEQAVESLQCALTAGVTSAQALRQDTLLEPLREDPRFIALLGS